MRVATVLVVDDNASDIALVRHAFAEAGIDAAIDGMVDSCAALERIARLADTPREGWPALVLLDLNMPRLDGHALLEKVRADPRLADLPIVVLTTSSAPSDRERCLRGGAQDLLVKPRRFADFVSLAKGLRRWLDRDGAAGRQPVLLVDNNLADLGLLQEAFREVDSSRPVAIAHDGAEALAWLGHHPPPALIVLDLNLSLVHGREVLDAVRRLPGMDAVPIVVLTSVATPEARAECLARGATGFHAKPTRYAALVELVRSLK